VFRLIIAEKRLGRNYTRLVRLQTLHPWRLPLAQAVALQRELAASVRLEKADVARVRLVAGVDVSCTRFDPMLTAGVVVWDREDGRVVDVASAKVPGAFPYIPGLLSFREIPALEQAISSLNVMPDAWLVDGHGIAHPRRLGIAAHFGLLLDMPTVGVAKSRLCGEFEEPGPRPGDRSVIMHRDDIIGCALRTRERASPLIISPGHRATLEDAVALVMACCRGYRLPEPTRLAHNYVNAVRKGEGWPVDADMQPSLL
jgi:deoxyribonuclease V